MLRERDQRFVQVDGVSTGTPPPALAWPVGSVFTAVIATNPADLLGYGTWSPIAAGRVLVGLDSGDTDFDTLREESGAKTVASAGSNANESTHTHSVTSNVAVGDHASHTHDVTSTVDADTETADANIDGVTVNAAITPLLNATNTSTGPSATLTHSVTNNAVTSGAGAAHTHTFTGSATSVVQPSFVVYFWERTA